MYNWPRAFALAMIFLTRIPMPKLAEVNARDEGAALLFFPVVGFILGGIFCLAGMLALPTFGPIVTAALLIALWAAITGGLHLDGLADSADGWLGGYGDPERTLTIMQDSRCGAGAVVAVVCVLLVKFAALTLVLQHQFWSALWVAPIIGRCTGPLLFLKGRLFYAPYAKASGIVKSFIEHCPVYARHVSYASLLVGFFILGSSLRVIFIFLICAVTLLLLRRLMIQRLGGATGDTAGASTEILETVFILCCGGMLV